MQYDAAGHITSAGTNSYTYTDRGRMSSAVTAGGTVNYLYNGLNQRVGKSGPTALVPTGAAYYLYDEAGQLLGEYDAAGVPIYETIYLGSLPVGVMKQTGSAASSDIAVNLYNLHADHIATPRVITRQADQAIVWRWDSAEAFGGTAPEQDPSGLGAFTFNQRFPGQVFDAETGLFQNWNREYNARQGRYIQSDPIGLDGGINTFAYVGGNPLSFTDPIGLQAYDGQLPPSNVPGGPWTPAGSGQAPGTFFGPPNPNGGPRDICRYVPDGANGGPGGAKESYWKTQEPGQKGWSSFDSRGNSITSQQAHPGNPRGAGGGGRGGGGGGGGGGGPRNPLDRNRMLYW